MTLLLLLVLPRPCLPQRPCEHICVRQPAAAAAAQEEAAAQSPCGSPAGSKSHWHQLGIILFSDLSLTTGQGALRVER